MGGRGQAEAGRGRREKKEGGGKDETSLRVVMKKSMLLAVTTCCCPVAAFLPLRHSSISRKLSIHCHAATPSSSSSTRLNDRKAEESDREIDSEMISQRDWNSNIPNDIGLEIIRGSENDISDEIWRDIEGGAPSQWMVMKNVSYL